MDKTKRYERIARVIHNHTTEYLQINGLHIQYLLLMVEMNNPNNAFIHYTLSTSISKHENSDIAHQKLSQHLPKIRTYIAKQARLRYTPMLHLIMDSTYHYPE
ncbi:MAG: hypothetical protein VXY77_02430 [Pseudomonadota bacterium]|nr:hypothetical protein [Pseudomonadota bacterium]